LFGKDLIFLVLSVEGWYRWKKSEIGLANNKQRIIDRQAEQIKELEKDCNCVKSLCDSMDEFGEPMKDTQWTKLGERIYEIVAELMSKDSQAQ